MKRAFATSRLLTTSRRLPTVRKSLGCHVCGWNSRFDRQNAASNIQWRGAVRCGALVVSSTASSFPNCQTFSSITSPTDGTTDQLSVLRQTTTRLLDAPNGSLDSHQWSEAYYAILEWLKQMPTSETKQTIVRESVLRSLHLLDRLRSEHESMKLNADTNAAALPSFFQTDLLNLVLNHWRKSIISGFLRLDRYNDNDNIDVATLHPKHMWQRLRHYHESAMALQPDVQSFAMIVDGVSALVAASSSGSVSSCTESRQELMLLVDDIIKWIVKTASLTKVDETRQAQLTTMRPNVILFSSAMNAWVKSGLSEAPVKVEELLEEMKLLNDEFPEWEDIQPNKVSYSTAIDAWAKTGNVDKVQGLLQEMHQLHHDTNDESIKPGLHAFNGYLVALVKQGRAEEAEAVLHQMEDFYESGELDEAPTVVSYSTVLDGFARSKMDGASYQAESLLRQMFVRQEENRGVKPNAISFNSVIHAHIQSGNIQAAEVLLHEMNDAYSSTGDTEIRPTLETYGNILSGLAKSRRKDAGERAENLLKYIKDMAVSGALEGPPDDVIYNAVLDCWAKSGNENSAQRARAVLDGMKEDGVSPDVISYNTVIQCMAKSRKLREAETLLNDMEKFGVQPNGITYNSLLSAYVASAPPGGKKQQQFSGRIAFLADCVEKLFERMKQDTNIPADVVTHNTVLNFYSKIGDVDRVTMLFNAMLSDDSAVRPDTTSVNTVINAWANSGRPDAAEQAENIFDELLLGEGSDLSPNPISFNSVMKAWTKSRAPEAAERCQRFFDVLKRDFAGELRPDFVTFNILIHAWSLSEDDNAPDFAERTFEEMKRRYEEGESRMRPNNMTFGALINVWSKSSRPEAGEKAGLYLRNIIQNSERGSNGEQPRVFEFTSAIRAWEKSGDVRAPFKADEILYLLLKEVKEGNKMAKPDSQFFGAFLSCLASSRVADKCLYANRVVQMMKDFRIRPNRFLLYQIKKCYAQDAHSKETKSSVESSQALQ